MITKLKLLRFPGWTAPLALLAVCLLAYGLLINRLGFYWDDWEPILVGKIYPLGEFWNYFASNRPAAAWTFILSTAVLGGSPLGWQIFALLLHWGTAALAAWMLWLVWPRRRAQAVWVAALFAVYPVFNQQPIAVSYHQHWLDFCLFFLSMGWMVLAVLHPKRAWLYTLLALIAFGLDLTITEYFVGMELLRPIVLWILLKRPENLPRTKMVEGAPIARQGKRLWLRVFQAWLPYFAALLAFTVWRIIYSMQNPDSANRPELLLMFQHNPVSALVHLFQIAGQDLIFIFASSWYNTLVPALLDFSKPILIGSLALAGVVSVGFGLYLSRLDSCDETTGWLEWAWVGLLAAIFGSLPIWSTNRQAILGLYSNRFAMVSMFGASMVFVALIDGLLRSRAARIGVLALLVGLSSGYQLRATNDFRWSWNKQTQFYWQLFWRAPDLRPGTQLVSDGDFLQFVRPTYAVNLLYGQPRGGSRQFAYRYAPIFASPEKVLDEGPYEYSFREFRIANHSKDSLAFYFNPPNCLWMLNPEDGDVPYLPPHLQEAQPASKLNLILPENGMAGLPFTDVFGAEPERGWCYRYEKADLARQFGEWDTVIAIGDQARQDGYLSGTSPHEWLPFLEAYLRAERWTDAVEVTRANFQKDYKYAPPYCTLWNRLANAPASQPARQEIFDLLGC